MAARPAPETPADGAGRGGVAFVCAGVVLMLHPLTGQHEQPLPLNPKPWPPNQQQLPAAPPHPPTPPLLTRLGVDDDVILLDQPLLQQRHQRDLDGRGVAAGVGDQPRLSDVVAQQLGQAVDGLLLKLGGGVLAAVPGWFFYFWGGGRGVVVKRLRWGGGVLRRGAPAGAAAAAARGAPQTTRAAPPSARAPPPQPAFIPLTTRRRC